MGVIADPLGAAEKIATRMPTSHKNTDPVNDVGSRRWLRNCEDKRFRIIGRPVWRLQSLFIVFLR